MLVRPLILLPPTVVRALRGDPADLLVCAGPAGGRQRRRALRALHALSALFSMTRK